MFLYVNSESCTNMQVNVGLHVCTAPFLLYRVLQDLVKKSLFKVSVCLIFPPFLCVNLIRISSDLFQKSLCLLLFTESILFQVFL